MLGNGRFPNDEGQDILVTLGALYVFKPLCMIDYDICFLHNTRLEIWLVTLNMRQEFEFFDYSSLRFIWLSACGCKNCSDLKVIHIRN